MTPRPLYELLTARLSGTRAPILSAGLMAADLGSLTENLATVAEAGVEMVHVDVMDGRFCGPITVGPAVLRAIPAPLIIDVHLLVAEPWNAVDSFLDAGADMVTIHVEAGGQPRAVLRRIGQGSEAREPKKRVLRGVAVNPSTPVDIVEPLLEDVDYILLLAIDPGWPGQSFAPSVGRRLQRVRRLVEMAGVDVAVGIDGGVTSRNFSDVAALGADVVVSGSAIFSGQDVGASARKFLEELAWKAPDPSGIGELPAEVTE